MKIKILSLLLAISLIAGLLPVATVGAETTATTAPATAATTVPTATPATTAPTTKPAATTAATTKATTPTPAGTVTPPATTLPSTTAPTVTDPTSSEVSISVKLCETSVAQDFLAVLTVSKGGAPVYATTKDSGVPTLVTNGSVPTNNYVKFEYPQNGLPTITLMNAKLRSSGNVLDLSSFDIAVNIVIAGNSTIESTGKCGIFRASYGDITILGPKKLTMNCSSSAIAFSGDPYANSLALKGLTLKASTFSDTAGRTFHIPAGNLTIDGCNIDLVNRVGNAVYLGQGNVSDAKGRGNATISKSVFSANSKNTALQIDGNMAVVSSNTQLSSDTRALFCVGDLTLNDSTMVMTGHSNTVETVNVGGEFTLRASNAEIIGTRFVIFSDTTHPRTIGKHTVVAGISRDSAAPYNEALASAYQYYYAESLEQPTDPTTPSGSETDPTGTVTDPTETDPTDYSTDPTFAPPAEPTGDPISPPEITLPTLPTPTISTNSTSGRSGAMFWILTVLMILCACGATAMAISMFRRSAAEAYVDELEEESEETPVEEVEDRIKKFSWEKFKKFSCEKLKKFKTFFAKKSKEDISEDVDIEEEIWKEILEEPLQDIDEDELEAILKEFHEDPVEESEEVAAEESQKEAVEETRDETAEDSAADLPEKPKKFSTEKLSKFFAKLLDEDTEEDKEK